MSKTKVQGSWDHLLTEISSPKDRDSSGKNLNPPHSAVQSSASKSSVKGVRPSVSEKQGQQIYTVSEINRIIKRQLEGAELQNLA